jgi:hypothetical protein
MNGDLAQSDDSPGSGPLTWDNAVCAATALLIRRYVEPDIRHHPALAREAQRLAALLCAYGQFPAAINHRHAATMNAGKPTASTLVSPRQVGAPANDRRVGEFVASPGIEQTI